MLYYSDEKVIDFCRKANRLGLQIELHAIGDRAFDQAARYMKRYNNAQNVIFGAPRRGMLPKKWLYRFSS